MSVKVRFQRVFLLQKLEQRKKKIAKF